MTLTQNDNGKSIKLRPGDTVRIQLDENPTTGFRWAVDKTDKLVVMIAHDSYNAAPAGGIGGGGTRTFTLKAVQAGTVQFQLKRWREWEGATSIQDQFEITIEVA